MPQDIGPETRRFLGYRELRETLHMSRTHLYRLEQSKLRLSPDVLVLPKAHGWDRERVLAFGKDTGRLDEHGQPKSTWNADSSHLPRQDNGKWMATESQEEIRALVVRKYSKPTRVYLGSWHCSWVYGLQNPAVYHLRRRDGFIPADVKVGDVYGWAEDRVIEFGRQSGRLPRAKMIDWAFRRTEELALDPRVKWVEKLLGEEKLALPQVPEPLQAA